MIKRVLVALSGTPYTASAIRHALALAETHETELTGVTLVDTNRIADVGPVPIGGGAAAHALAEHRLQVTEERIEEQIKEFEEACRRAGRPFSVVRETGDPMDELAHRWRYHDLTVFGLRGLFEYGVVHRPDDALLRLIARGVRPIIAVAHEYRPIKRALIAYSGSMESAKAMKRFIQINPWPGVDLKIICFNREDANGLLADAAAYCMSHGHRAETESVDGSPVDLLLDHAAAWSADLIVMGSTGRISLFKKIMGKTVLHAIKNSEIPLFLSQ